jgi:hypothetical protein
VQSELQRHGHRLAWLTALNEDKALVATVPVAPYFRHAQGQDDFRPGTILFFLSGRWVVGPGGHADVYSSSADWSQTIRISAHSASVTARNVTPTRAAFH